MKPSATPSSVPLETLKTTFERRKRIQNDRIKTGTAKKFHRFTWKHLYTQTSLDNTLVKGSDKESNERRKCTLLSRGLQRSIQYGAKNGSAQLYGVKKTNTMFNAREEDILDMIRNSEPHGVIENESGEKMYIYRLSVSFNATVFHLKPDQFWKGNGNIVFNPKTGYSYRVPEEGFQIPIIYDVFEKGYKHVEVYVDENFLPVHFERLCSSRHDDQRGCYNIVQDAYLPTSECDLRTR